MVGELSSLLGKYDILFRLTLPCRYGSILLINCEIEGGDAAAVSVYIG